MCTAIHVSEHVSKETHKEIEPCNFTLVSVCTCVGVHMHWITHVFHMFWCTPVLHMIYTCMGVQMCVSHVLHMYWCTHVLGYACVKHVLRVYKAVVHPCIQQYMGKAIKV